MSHALPPLPPPPPSLTWRQRIGVAAELVLAAAFASLAVQTGSWPYAGTSAFALVCAALIVLPWGDR